MPGLIQELAKETCAANGVKLERLFQPAPAIADLNPPRPPEKKPPAV